MKDEMTKVWRGKQLALSHSLDREQSQGYHHPRYTVLSLVQHFFLIFLVSLYNQRKQKFPLTNV